MTELLQRITIDAGKNGGRPSIRGLRVGVDHVLEMLASGMTAEQVIEDFPYLEADDVRAVLAYAAARAAESQLEPATSRLG